MFCSVGGCFGVVLLVVLIWWGFLLFGWALVGHWLGTLQCFAVVCSGLWSWLILVFLLVVGFSVVNVGDKLQETAGDCRRL